MTTYAFKNTKSEQKRASSGGAFNAFVRTFMAVSSNPVIIGAAFSEENEVQHECAFTLDEAEKFNGSKYVKSNISGIYARVGELLQRNYDVLFSGTPCQINGLRKYLQKQSIGYERLVLIDIICHGTPSEKVFDDYKKWIEKKYNKKIKSIRFRDKRGGWKDYSMSIIFDDGTELFDTYDVRTYMRLFFSCVITNKGCFSCPFANTNRVSDLTLGDFWGISKIIPEIDIEDGVSLIIANTLKGNRLIEQLKEHYDKHGFDYMLKKYDGDEFLKYQWNLNQPSIMPNNYETFNTYYKANGFEDTIKKYNYNSFVGRARYIAGKCKRIILRRL